MSNDVIDAIMNRKSIRKYTTQMPSDEILEAVVRAGQQAPFAAQLCSVMLTRRKGVPFGHLCFSRSAWIFTGWSWSWRSAIGKW
jgi:nitroreductase